MPSAREIELAAQVRQLASRIEVMEQAERVREATLHDSLDFTRLALTAVRGIGVWTFDAASDRFYCDAAIAEVYGLDAAIAAAGILRADFLANVHPDDMAALRATMSGGLLRAGDLELEYRICHPDGSTRWVLSRGNTYFNERGEPVRRTGVGIDMTSQRLLEQQLRQSQKMEAVGQLTGGIAHDFNNLLGGIMGTLDIMAVRIGQQRHDDLGRYITMAQGAAKRAAALTHRLLAFSRRQTLAPTATGIDRLVAGMEELIRRTVGPQIGIEVAPMASPWPVLVDGNQLENALLNLCINSRDAMPDGGQIHIATDNVTLDVRQSASLGIPAGDDLCLRVSDTGAGMTPAVIAHAFDPFFTTKPMGQGTGLGLSMIYGFVRQSGGQVHIASTLGKGTTISLYLPRHAGSAAPLPEATEPAAMTSIAGGLTVMVVDDEPMMRMLVTEVLEELGHTPIQASDGAQALQMFGSETRIDLLITDVGLPGGLNGRQVADAARLARADLKVLFITGYAENAVMGNEALDAGMHLMTKPFSIDALKQRILELLAIS
ncbi:MAG: ATP-binding protein [Janthinobacterium lividum]